MASLTKKSADKPAATTLRETLPAKLTRPHSATIILRRRLFDSLDAALLTPVVWIEGPPGAGKTTLVSSYIEQRGLPCIWYQVDTGDADPASFFHYLGLAAKKAAPRTKRELPHLTPEYLPSLSIFTRRYFEEFYRRLKVPSLLVFDNYQEADTDAIFHQIMANAISLLPKGITVIVISRAGVPANFARLRASGSFSLLGWDDLKLTEEESRDLARLRAPVLPEYPLARICDQVQGWAAGLVLALERGQQLKDDHTLTTPQAVFDYFAAEIFERMDLLSQRILMECAFLPHITVAQAVTLTGLNKAGQVFKDLCARGYFIVKHAAAGYQLHPLFREFLIARACSCYDEQTLAETQQIAANILEDDGKIAEAMELLANAGVWDDLAGIITRHAKGLILQGRGQTIETWIRALPEDWMHRDPWLSYWYARCSMTSAPHEARSHLENAYAQFGILKDATGLYLTWASIIDSYVYTFNDFRTVGRWIEEFKDLSRRYPSFPSHETESRVTAGMFTALGWYQPQNPELSSWAEKVRKIVLGYSNDSMRISLSNFLMFYDIWAGDLDKAALVLERLRPSIHHVDHDPVSLQWWHAQDAMHAYLVADKERCLDAISRGEKIGEETGVHMFEFLLLAQGVYCGVSMGDLAMAESMVSKMHNLYIRQATEEGCFHFVADKELYSYAVSEYLWARGDLNSALEQGKLCLSHTTNAHIPEALGRTGHALTLFEAGRIEEAENELKHAMEMSAGLNLLDCTCCLTTAWIALVQGQHERVIDSLRRGLAIAAKQNYVNFPRWREHVMSTLCAIALEHNIESSYVHRLITFRKLPPPVMASANLDAWPWPVKIRTLGGLYIECNGVPVRFTGKVQHRPLQLLKLIISFGVDGASETILAESMWPDAEGDTARMNLRPAVHRLRKLIGVDVICVEGGRVSIDQRNCWVDAWSLERQLNKYHQSIPEDAFAAYERARGMLAMYTGPFLAGDESPESLIIQERIKLKLIRHILTVGSMMQKANAFNEAAILYEYGIDIDPYVEAIHAQLIQCHMALGMSTEAILDYERCSSLFCSKFGIEPSSEIQMLIGNLREIPSQ